ncbi:hypothetical protein [Agromyces mediolanus]|uniref:hypothetical protein n=1 Tax=Agromyces mediolanus TaxID=41986 RepID=UPI00204175DF|nr:hypothetical protein [Agromyces mediolanus]
MRLAAILSEAWRNSRSGASHGVLLWLVLSFLTIGLTTADALATRAAVEEALDYRAAGAAIATIEAVGAIDGTSCDAIASVDGVAAAGALRPAAGPLLPSATPGSSLPAYEATPAFTRLLGSSGAHGAVLSRVAADRLGLRTGDVLTLSSGAALTIAGVYEWPEDGRRPGLGYAAVVPALANGAFDECWATTWPQSAQLVTLLRSTAMPSSAESASAPVLSTVNSTFGAEFHGGDRHLSRPTRFAPLAALVAAAFSVAIAVRSRRLALSSARHHGVRRADVMAVVGAETAWVMVPVAIAAVAAATLVGASAPADGGAVFEAGLRVLAGTSTGAFLGAAVAAASIRANGLLSAFTER